jgi:hypothetical protein
MFVYESKDFWRQIKTAGSAVPASALYLAQFQKTNSKFLTPPGKAGSEGPTILPPVFIDPTAEVDETAKIGPNVSLGGCKDRRRRVDGRCSSRSCLCVFPFIALQALLFGSPLEPGSRMPSSWKERLST